MIAQITALGHMRSIRIIPRFGYESDVVKTINCLAPFFERSSFLKEETSRQELAALHDLGFIKMTQEDLLECKAALNVLGYNPAIKLINLLADNDVLGFSRPGVDWHPHLNLLTNLLPKLKQESCATHLALAVPVSLQRLLDVFIVTGEIFPNLSPINLADYGLSDENDFVHLLKVARLAGFKLVAVQPNTAMRAFDPLYDRAMANNVQAILNNEKGSKVIFLAPDKHLSYSNVGDWLPVASLLKQKGFNICTITQYWQGDFMPKVFASLLQGLISPIALLSKDVKKFAALQNRSLALEQVLPENWDMTIIYPKRQLDGKSSFWQRIVRIGMWFSTNISALLKDGYN